jgi:hypothetical protein
VAVCEANVSSENKPLAVCGADVSGEAASNKPWQSHNGIALENKFIQFHW